MKLPGFVSQVIRSVLASALLSSQILPAEDHRPPQITAVDLLIVKARSLESRDRPDLAAQVWQQILVSDPNQPDALSGLARWAKRSGRTEEANTYLSKLRRVAPDAPALSETESANTKPRSDRRLDEAGKLAANGHFDEAMKLYRDVFGPEPPAGGWAISYYETLANTHGGFEPAVAALRNLAATYPSILTYQLSAGKLMTYRPATRQSGVGLLASLPSASAVSTKARESWRQALLWEKNNPSFLSSYEAYLGRYSDPELQGLMASLHAKAKSERVNTDTVEEQHGYVALHSGNSSDAEKDFAAALSKDGRSSRAHAGLGYVRMKASDFDAAVQEFEAAQKVAPNDSAVREALKSARFWQAMRQGAKAADAQSWTEAAASYQTAVNLQPKSTEAVRALGGALLAAGSPEKALPYLASAVHGKSSDEASWYGYVTCKLQVEGGKAALAVMQSVPEGVAASLNHDVSWKALQASAYLDAGENDLAGSLYREIIALHPGNLTISQDIQVASLALAFHQPIEALPYAQRAMEAGESNPAAWEVYLPALLGSGRPQEAQRAYARMPGIAQKIALTHPSFLQAAASLKQSGGDLEGARTLLEQAATLSGAVAGESARVSIQLQLAQVLAQAGKTAEAEAIVTSISDAHADSLDAWRARLFILQAAGRENAIVELAARMPQSIALRLGNEGDVVSLLARAHQDTGDPASGVKLLETFISRTPDPDATVNLPQRIQLGWLLLDAPRDGKRLYAVLDSLNAHTNLTAEQRKEVTDLWTSWILRSSDKAHRANDQARALGILEQGLNMFPGNVDLERAYAGNLLASGNTHRAFNAYSNWGLAGATASDYAGAISAAVSDHNMQYADTWVSRGLAQWPTDPKLLELAGERAQAHGNLKQAETYWREALAERKAQPEDAASIAGNAQTTTSLKSLLVGNDTSTAGALNTGSPRVHLSNFSDSKPVREDLVQSNALVGEPLGVFPAAQSSFLLKPAVSVASEDALTDKLASLESRNSPYLGSRMTVWGRGGEAGFGKLLIEQSQFEASTTLANTLRASLLLEPTYLSGGTASGTGDSLFGRQTAAGSFGPQSASGLAAEAQLATQSYGVRIGMTPEGFLTHNWLGGVRIQPKDGPITILLERDSVKDSMLAYAGAHDPQSGTVWGGVMADTGTVQGRWGDDRSGFYANGSYQVLDGRHVAGNTGITGGFGAYWKVVVTAGGSLTVGTNFSAMHYEHNLRYFTYGQGGYFSPQQYFLFNVPVRWSGNFNRRLQYVITGSLGLQHFIEDESAYYPTDAALQARTGSMYPALLSTGANFNFDSRLNYQLTPHWILGAFASANNARNYTSAGAGMFLKYTFEERPMSFEGALPSIPDWRGQQPFLIH